MANEKSKMKPIALLLTCIALTLSGCGAFGKSPASYLGIDLKPAANAEPSKLQSLASRAKSGDKQAQLELGILFEAGRAGVEKDTPITQTGLVTVWFRSLIYLYATLASNASELMPPSYVAGELADYLAEKNMKHVRGAPFHPQTQGKIERQRTWGAPDIEEPHLAGKLLSAW